MRSILESDLITFLTYIKYYFLMSPTTFVSFITIIMIFNFIFLLPFYTAICLVIGIIMSNDPVSSFMLIYFSSFISNLIAYILFRKDIGKIS